MVNEVRLISSKLLVISAFSFFIQSCSSSGPTQYHQTTMDQILIADPLPINYKHEVAIASLSQAIQRADVSNGQRAEFYYQRGTYYDKVGLRTLAFFDFKHALKLKPDLVEAYNFIGIHYTQLQQFDQAYEAFDSAIELDANHEYAYLNRGIALYFSNKPKLAQQDLIVFLAKQPEDPYRVLWLYFAESVIDPTQALANLNSRNEKIPGNIWGKYLIELFAGRLTEADIFQLISRNVKSKKELVERLCEAYFYLGKYHSIKGDEQVAENYFKLALSTNVYEFVEHRYARLELDLKYLANAKVEQQTSELTDSSEQ